MHEFNIILMIVALFFVKNKIALFILWLLCCFTPFFLFVYQGEQSDLGMTKSMGENVFLFYFQIFITTFIWIGGEFLISFICYKILRFLFR